MNLYALMFGFLFVMFPFVRCFCFNPHNTVFYGLYDSIEYVLKRKWKDFKYFGIDMFVGMFGHGKTLTMTHRARKLYKKFGNSLLFISNYKLVGIPYIELINFNQLCELGEEKPKYLTYEEVKNGAIPSWYYDDNGEILEQYLVKKEKNVDINEKEVLVVKYNKILRPVYKGTVVLIDEIQSVLSHRNYANFPLELLNTLTQQRKKHVYIMCTAQRFFMVDKLFRSITTHVYDCNKYWRFQNQKCYDAWDYENAMNTQLLRPLRSSWWFVKNKDFDSYDTEQMIDRNMSENFISNEEAIVRKGLDATVNENAIQRPSRGLKKQRKMNRKSG